MQLLREVEYQIRLVMIGLAGIDVVGLAYGNVGRSIGKWEYRDDAVAATAAVYRWIPPIIGIWR